MPKNFCSRQIGPVCAMLCEPGDEHKQRKRKTVWGTDSALAVCARVPRVAENMGDEAYVCKFHNSAVCKRLRLRTRAWRRCMEDKKHIGEVLIFQLNGLGLFASEWRTVAPTG